MEYKKSQHSYPSLEITHWYETQINPAAKRKHRAWLQVENTGKVPLKDIKIYIQANNKLDDWDMELIDTERQGRYKYIEFAELSDESTSEIVEYYFRFDPLDPSTKCEMGSYSFRISPVYTIDYKSSSKSVSDEGLTICST